MYKKRDNYIIVVSLSDRNRTNFNIIYGRFEEIGLPYLVSVFRWLCKYGLDVLLGIGEIFFKTEFCNLSGLLGMPQGISLPSYLNVVLATKVVSHSILPVLAT